MQLPLSESMVGATYVRVSMIQHLLSSATPLTARELVKVSLESTNLKD